MSREIKFRAWNKQTNKMMYESDKGFIGWGIDAKDVVKWLHFENNDIKIGMFIGKRLQYTGMSDTNLEEICEGDIVKINDKLYSITKEIGSFMLVKCNEETDMYEEFKNCWNDNVYPLSQLYWENYCEEDYIYQLEIVGNIYENKDLLE